MMFVKIFFRYLSFFLILGFLIAISIIENKLVTDSMIKVNTYCFSIENYISEHEEYRTMELVTLVDNLEYNWEKGESGISFMVNHKSIHEIAVEIEKLKTYIAEDDIRV